MKRFTSRYVQLTDGRQEQSSAPIALSMALLISAGLFIRSLANVSRVDLGITVDRLVTFAISPSLNGYQPARSARALSPRAQPARSAALFNRTVEELQALLGVSAVTSARVAVLTGDNWGSSVSVEGFKKTRDTVAQGGGRERGIRQEVQPWAKCGRDSTVGGMIFYIRTASEPEQVIRPIPSIGAKLDPNLPVEDLKTLPQQVKEHLFMDRMISTLSVVFAVLAP